MITNTYLDNDEMVGRLGNKMFIIAAILGAAKSFGNDKHPAFPHWKCEHIFKHKLFYYDSEPIIQNRYQEPYFHFCPIDVRKDGNTNVLGYFQSWRYFDHIHEDIIHHFEPSKEVMEEIMDKYYELIEEKTTVSVHVRRGDYVEDPSHHPAITSKYIINSINKFNKDNKFVFFSDDIEWCKNTFGNISSKNIEFISDVDYIDLFLMSMLKNNIIANSSFSWWAAYLNKNEYKRVIHPNLWFGKSYNHDIKDLCPENWSVSEC